MLMHNEELHNVYATPDIVRVIESKRGKREEHVARMEEMIHSYNILIGRSEGRRSLGRPRRKWENSSGILWI
jgi:hypothetical protein